jgi:hypothetical protein
MCIVIDASALSYVFNDENEEHREFKPVHDWITEGKGKMVAGGTKYDDELAKLKTYTKLFGELSRANKLRYVDSGRVDNLVEKLKLKEKSKNFDDPHIVAIVVISGVNLICTKEVRAIPFFTRKEFYPNRSVPKIYSSSANARLLNGRYCRHCSISCNKANKVTSDKIRSSEEIIKEK